MSIITVLRHANSTVKRNNNLLPIQVTIDKFQQRRNCRRSIPSHIPTPKQNLTTQKYRQHMHNYKRTVREKERKKENDVLLIECV